MKKILIGLFFVLSTSSFANDIVVDKETGLAWQDSPNIVEKNWSSAKSYCNNLSLSGYSNWRLPHIDELISIVDTNKKNPAIKTMFKNTKYSYYSSYWSSTGDIQNSFIFGRVVSFNDGNDDRSSVSNERYVRCVGGRR